MCFQRVRFAACVAQCDLVFSPRIRRKDSTIEVRRLSAEAQATTLPACSPHITMSSIVTSKPS